MKIAFGFRSPAGQEERLGLGRVAVVILKQRAVQIVGAALDRTFTAAPPASPVSASKEFVVTFTTSIASSAGVYPGRCGSQIWLTPAPSMRTALELRDVPFTL